MQWTVYAKSFNLDAYLYAYYLDRGGILFYIEKGRKGQILELLGLEPVSLVIEKGRRRQERI